MNCRSCNAPTTNGLALCGRCRQTMSVSLTNAAAYYADVDRIRPGQRVKVRSAYRSTPPPGTEPRYDPIGFALDAADNTTSTWARALTDDRPEVPRQPKGTAATMSWLEQHIASVATLEWGGEMLRDMLAVERRLQRALDEADTGWYAGKCGSQLEPERYHDGTTCICACHLGVACDIPGGCGEPGLIPGAVCERPLYGTPGVNWIRCGDCGTTYDVQQRRDTLMREARDHAAPVTVVARAVVGLLDDEVSVERLSNRLDQWVRRGKLLDIGVRVMPDGKPYRVYRLGDVFDLLKIGEARVVEIKSEGQEAC